MRLHHSLVHVHYMHLELDKLLVLLLILSQLDYRRFLALPTRVSHILGEHGDNFPPEIGGPDCRRNVGNDENENRSFGIDTISLFFEKPCSNAINSWPIPSQGADAESGQFWILIFRSIMIQKLLTYFLKYSHYDRNSL